MNNVCLPSQLLHARLSHATHCTHLLSCTHSLTPVYRHGLQPERNADVDPKKVVRHVHVSQKGVSAAQHGEASSVPLSCSSFKLAFCDVSAGPVAFVLATLYEDFGRTFKGWVDSV